MKPLLALAAVLTLAGGCASLKPRPASASTTVWRGVASLSDVRRLHRWRDAFMAGLTAAQSGGAAAQTAAEGALLQPDAQLEPPLPPPGEYRCRIIKLGLPGGDLPSYVPYPAFRCRVAQAGGRLSFTKITGSQRQVGFIYPDTMRRGVFLGTMLLADEARPLPYGRDEQRDLVASVERVGPQRWRLVFPYPRFESLVDVMELVPA